MSRVPVWRAVRGSGRLASGGVRLVWDALVIAGPWFYLPALAGILAWWAGFAWWIGSAAAALLGLYCLADNGKDGPSASRFSREAQHRLEEARARAKARQIRREWPRLCQRAGWMTPEDLEKRRPVPSLRFTRTMGRRLLVAWRPPERVPPTDYGTHVEQLRRVIGAHSADYRPVTADPGTLVGLFGMDALPDMAAAPSTSVVRGDSGPVGGQMEAPLHGPESSAVQQAGRPGIHGVPQPRFVLGVGTGGADVTWAPFESPHMLVTGATGGGKGSVTRTLVSQALEWVDWEVTVIDGKEGGEYAWAEQHGAHLGRTGVMVACDLAGDLEYDLKQRAATLYAAGVERWQDLDNPESWVCHLVVVDELADLLAQRKGADKIEDQSRADLAARLNRLVAQGRAVGIYCVLALQRPDANIVSGFMRNNLSARVAVGHLDESGSEMMFGLDGKQAALAYLDGTPGRAVAVGLSRGHVNPSPLQVHYLRAVDLRPSAGLVAS